MPTATSSRLSGKWTFDPIHSFASFTVNYLVAPFRAEFQQLSAELSDGRLSGVVDVASLRLKNDAFLVHLQGPDFFDADRFPTISFSSTEIVLSGDNVLVDGQLTLKGVSKPVRGNGTIAGPTDDFHGDVRLGLALRSVIDRTAFGLSWNAALPKGGTALGNNVKLFLELEFIARP